MEFTSFKTLVREEVERRAGKKYRVRLNDVMKNNGVVLSGLTVMQDDSNISPTIYLNDYYNAYENGRTTLGMVINDVMDVYNRNKVNRKLDMRYFLNYEHVKEQIVLKLINTEKNKELLSDIPHVEFLDLSIVFQVLISDENIGGASVMIHNAHAKLWGVDSKELYKCALKNTPKLLKYEIKGMNDVICEIMETDRASAPCCGEIPMYVLSNSRRIEGAACMIYPQLIEDFATAVGGNLYIIPSSVHELLLLPACAVDNGEELINIIKEVNETQLLTEEILSDSLYVYDCKEKAIKIF
ncbi:MAG: hypothetical protein K2N89_01445 [Lachnospiraceae bacterium]|nr:hypothetical protein [Lachnospiraceae bacterium]